MEVVLLYLIIIAIILISLTVHELGHFFTGIIFNVNIKEISIGIGPRIFVWRSKKRGYDVSIRILPIMAYVMLDSHAIRDLYKDFPEEKQYYYYMSFIPNKKILLEDTKYWQYTIIMLAGIAINFILFFIFWGICAGVAPIIQVLIKVGPEQYELIHPVLLNPFIQFGNSMIMLGHNMIFYNPGGTGGSFINQIMFVHTNMNGWLWNFLNMFMSLNLMLGILNLLPIPPLDGYKALSNTYYKITHKKINKKLENGVSIFCIALLFYIFVSSILAGFVYWGS